MAQRNARLLAVLAVLAVCAVLDVLAGQAKAQFVAVPAYETVYAPTRYKVKVRPMRPRAMVVMPGVVSAPAVVAPAPAVVSETRVITPAPAVVTETRYVAPAPIFRRRYVPAMAVPVVGAPVIETVPVAETRAVYIP